MTWTSLQRNTAISSLRCSAYPD